MRRLGGPLSIAVRGCAALLQTAWLRSSARSWASASVSAYCVIPSAAAVSACV